MPTHRISPASSRARRRRIAVGAADVTQELGNLASAQPLGLAQRPHDGSGFLGETGFELTVRRFGRQRQLDAGGGLPV